MENFEVQCAIGDDHFCIEVPTNCSVGDVLKKASERLKIMGVSLWYSHVPLNCEHLFADYFETDVVYQVKVGEIIRKGTLLKSSESKLRSFGVNLTAPQLLMEMSESLWSMDDFLEKAGDFAPTLVLIRLKNGAECGGVAGVPWPKKGETAADPAEASFIFSLGATPSRLDLVDPEKALFCDPLSFVFGRVGYDLCVGGDGEGCSSDGEGTYAGPRQSGQIIGATAGVCFQPYERWELWGL
jgi:hypothetical protein